jgi:hypothetical protein
VLFSNLGTGGNYTIYLMDSNSCKNSISFALISPAQKLLLQASVETLQFVLVEAANVSAVSYWWDWRSELIFGTMFNSSKSIVCFS